MGLPKLRGVRTYNIPADPEGDRLANNIVRRYGLAEEQDYDKYLDKVKAKLAEFKRTGKMAEWPAGYVKKTRNPNAPKGKRWGNWNEGGKAP